MRKATAVLLFSAILTVAPAIAGPDHTHGAGGHTHAPATAEQVSARAIERVKSMVQRGKLDKSWANAKPEPAYQKDFAKGTEWVVAFRNEKMEDATKRTLYVFFSLEGSYIAANYSGK